MNNYTHAHTHFDTQSMSYIAPFWRLLTVSPSSLGSSGYLQNRFCQAHWSIMHWHQRAYFHFNNTEIFLLGRAFFFFSFHKSLWQNESGMEMIKQPFVSGHVSSVYLSEPLQRGWGNERGTMTGGTFSKTTPNHSLLPVTSLCTREICHNPTLSVTVSHGSSWIQQPTGASRPCQPVIFTMSCCSASNHW